MSKLTFNPHTCQWEMTNKKRPEDAIQLMNRCPGRSGWIRLMHDRVNMNSVGNNRYSKVMWFDLPTRTLSSDETKSDSVPFMTYMLPHCGRPGGWLPANGPKG